MGEPMTPEEMAMQLAQANEARRIAGEYAASQGGYSAAPPMASMANGQPELPPAGPPAAPPPGGRSLYENWKHGVGLGAPIMGKTLANAGATLVAPAVGGAVAGPAVARAITGGGGPSSPKKEEGAPPPAESAESPSPSTSGGNEPPLILPSRYGMGGRMIPGGMQPHSLSESRHMGREVPNESRQAFGAATRMELEGAEKQHLADRDYYAQVRNATELKMRASEDAAAQHARVQAERDQVVKQRMADIEITNQQASAAIDPNKFWSDRGSLATIFGALSIGLGEFASKLRGGPNAALNIIESGINQEIQAQLSNRQLAGQKVARQERLLDLHLGRLGDKDKAIDATKLGLYDNVSAQIEQFALENKGRTSEAHLFALQGAILEKRGELVNKMGLQESDDVNRQATEQYRPPQMVGGMAQPALPEPGHTVVIPPSNATKGKGIRPGKSVRVSIKEPATAERLQKEAATVGRLMDLNNKAIVARNTIKEAAHKPSWDAAAKAADARAELKRLEQEKVKLVSSKDMQGVLKEAEYFRSIDIESGYTNIDIVGNTNGRLQKENEHLYDGLNESVKAASGSEVEQGFYRDPKTGTMKKFEVEKGKLYEPSPVAPQQEKVK